MTFLKWFYNHIFGDISLVFYAGGFYGAAIVNFGNKQYALGVFSVVLSAICYFWWRFSHDKDSY